MRAAIYARVSSAEQQARNTIASQLDVLPRFCAERGWSVVATYVDDGKSAAAGKLAKRTGLAELLTGGRAGAFDVIAVVDFDRLTRTDDLGERGDILGQLQRARVQVAISSTGQVLDLSSSVGDLFSALAAWTSADENRKRSERIKRGKARAIGLGKKPAGPTPWGYVYDRWTGAWAVNPEQAALLKEIHARIQKGETCEAIANDLDRRGVVRTAPSKRGVRKPGRWSRERVYSLAMRTTYHDGKHVVDKQRKLSVAVPPIIDEATYRTTQERLARAGRRGNPRVRHERLIAGLAICDLCEAPIVSRQARSQSGRLLLYYSCSQRYPRDKERKPCRLKFQPADRVDFGTWDWVCRALDKDGELTRALEGYNADDGDLSLLERDLEAAESRLRRNAKAEERILLQQSEELISEDSARRELHRLTSERGFAQREVDGLREQRRRLQARQGSTDELANALERLRAVLPTATFAARRLILELLVPGGMFALRVNDGFIVARYRKTTAAELKLVVDDRLLKRA